VIEEKIDNQPISNEENKPKAEVPTEQSLIEIDGSVETSEKSKPLSPQAKKNKLKEMKAKKEAEYKAKQKEEKLRLKELKKLERVQNGGGSKINLKLIIIIILFVLLGGGFAFLYFKRPDILKKLIPGKHKENVVLVNSDSSVASETESAKSDTSSLAAEEQSAEAKETQTIPQPAPIPETKSAAVPQPVVKENPAKKENKSSEPLTGKTTKLNGPCWIVSFSSVEDEKVASKGVKKLVDKGFLGGYYWMPDINPGAKKLFKVYSGPYTSEQEARSKQREIAAFNQDAYVMKLNQ
jgi:cell division septation protein DedD